MVPGTGEVAAAGGAVSDKENTTSAAAKSMVRFIRGLSFMRGGTKGRVIGGRRRVSSRNVPATGGGLVCAQFTAGRALAASSRRNPTVNGRYRQDENNLRAE